MKKIIVLLASLFCIPWASDLRVFGNLRVTQNARVDGNDTVKGRAVYGPLPMTPRTGVDVNHNNLSGHQQNGIFSEPTCTSSADTGCDAVRGIVQTKDSTYTTPFGIAFHALTPKVGAGSAVTNMYGFKAEPVVGGAHNFAFASGGGLIFFVMGNSDSMYVVGGVNHFTGSFTADSIVQLGYTNINRQFSATITTINNKQTLDATRYVIGVDASGGNDTLILPKPSTCLGRVYIIHKVDTTLNVVVIIPDTSTSLIDGKPNILLGGNDGGEIQIRSVGAGVLANGSKWLVEAYKETGHFKLTTTGCSDTARPVVTYCKSRYKNTSLTIPAFSCTSNASFLQLNGVPANLTPSGLPAQNFPGQVKDSTISVMGMVTNPSSSGVITFLMMKATVTRLALELSTFRASGAKGYDGGTFEYSGY